MDWFKYDFIVWYTSFEIDLFTGDDDDLFLKNENLYYQQQSVRMKKEI
jgi:hypothetical protein